MGFDFDDPKNWGALLVGLIITALGAIPLLNGWGVIGFSLPGFIETVVSAIGLWVIAAVAFYLMINSFMEDDTMRVVSIIVALVLLAVGIIPLLHTFGVIGFTIPFLSVTVYNVIFVLEGLFLIFAAFAMM